MSAHVLLIEDDDDLRSELLQHLLRRSYRVTACATAGEAKTALENVAAVLAPDVVVSDIHLPDGDGVSFLVANARRFPRTRWILMSGNHELVRLGNRFRNLSEAPDCTVIDKPVPLHLLDRFISAQAA
jgi:DNA-binding NtrC family response regulator